jgi:hypothetical protein
LSPTPTQRKILSHISVGLPPPPHQYPITVMRAPPQYQYWVMAHTPCYYDGIPLVLHAFEEVALIQTMSTQNLERSSLVSKNEAETTHN